MVPGALEEEVPFGSLGNGLGLSAIGNVPKVDVGVWLVVSERGNIKDELDLAFVHHRESCPGNSSYSPPVFLLNRVNASFDARLAHRQSHADGNTYL